MVHLLLWETGKVECSLRCADLGGEWTSDYGRCVVRGAVNRNKSMNVLQESELLAKQFL